MDKKELGIYIHIPFCKKKCYYCDFISYTNKCNEIPRYIESLIKEIERFDFSSYKVSSIYIGGGTPSYIDSNNIARILEIIHKKAKIQDVEITIEVNPGTVCKDKLEDYKKAGINRLSIGLQATQNSLLKLIGRIHTYKEFIDTYETAKEVGFENINVDLILGLPKQTIGDLKESLKNIVKLNPNHISIYSLILEENTKMKKMVDDGILTLPEEDIERNMYWYVKNTLELNGYKHYEISNFSKPQKESRHNINCWEQKEYIGFGIAAHSYIGKTRFSNTKYIDDYILNIENDEFEKNVEIQEIQTKKDQEDEYMLLGFRKMDGVNIAKFKEKFVENPLYIYRNILDKLVLENLIEIDLNFIKLTNKGLDLANLVFEEFV